MRGASAARARAVRRGATRAASNAGERSRTRARENPRRAVERTTLRYDGHARVDGDAAGRAGSGDAIARERGSVAFACSASGSEVLCASRDGEGWEAAYAPTATLRDGDARADFDDAASAVYVGRDLRRGKRGVFAMVLRGGEAGERAMRAAFEAAAPAGTRFAMKNVKRATASFEDEIDAAIVANGAALIGWGGRQKFCRNCGAARPKIVKGGSKATCRECGRSAYPELMPCCLALITCGNYVLLGRNAKWPKNFYSLLAGFVEGSESLEACVAREALEEASIVVDASSVEYIASQPWPFPNQLMMGFRADVAPERLGPLKMPPEPKMIDGELADARWFHVDYLAARLSPERAFADPRGGDDDDAIPFGEIALPGEHALARVLVQNWVDEKMMYRRRRCDDRLVTTVVEGSFFTECELASFDDDKGDAFVFENDNGELQDLALHFVMVEVLLAQEGQAPVVFRAAPGDVSAIREDVVAEVERVGQGARAIAFVRATGRIKCKRRSDGVQSIRITMLSEASDDGFDARRCVVAMLQKACPFHLYEFDQP